MQEEVTYSLTETGNSIYLAYLEAYSKKHPELTKEQIKAAIREGKE